jgi:hypothetical protein
MTGRGLRTVVGCIRWRPFHRRGAIAPDQTTEAMIAAVRMTVALAWAKDAELSTEDWWNRSTSVWQRDDAYYQNIQAKADQHGREWVRKHIAEIHAYWKNALQLKALHDYLRTHDTLDDW